MTAFAGVRAVLFDLDGTLVDSAPDLAGAANAMRLGRQLAPLPLEHYRAHSGSGARGMLGVAFGVAPGDECYEVLRQEFFSHYQDRLLQHTRPFDGVERLLEVLVASGVFWGVVTNKGQRFTLPLTMALPLFAGAATVISGDTTPHSKPHPAPLLEAARRIGISPAECLYVGDDLRDIQAGRAAGMRTVAAMYGYLGPGADVSSWGADKLIETPVGLLKWLGLP
ncbi:HAD-IA family hydrolase [Hydrogenophaga pseudoflava]|uniref:HAD-IA family hydrolase n=1 Tax=Hydrogenophaga pseudoflava TaxID=47421 RepID=UPI0027E47966|nr:HAD-IA family hydrolase [Hydrogenophaga pseudoflava]MDQ7745659.1 HAD-IA family hydrolase [Hydrogenophaga pseudoflava]